MSKKKIIILVVIAIIIIAAATAVGIFMFNKKENAEEGAQEPQPLTLYDTNLAEYVKETENGTKINTSLQLCQDKKIGELTATGIQLSSKSGMTTLLATVINNSAAPTALQNVEVVFLGKNGEELAKARGIVTALEVGESTKLNITMSSNYVYAYDLAINVI